MCILYYNASLKTVAFIIFIENKEQVVSVDVHFEDDVSSE